MADLVFHCIHCGQRLEVDLSQAGSPADCPTCQQRITIPGSVAPVLAAPEQKPLIKRNQYLCPVCGTVGKPIKKTQGSFMVEVFLWLCFLLPGLIYTVWRIFNKLKVCPNCKSAAMIPATSPAVLEKYRIQ